MKINRRFQLLSAFGVLLFSAHIPAQPVDPAVDLSRAESYSDSHGSEVRFPQGGVSFADEVILYRPGNPAPLKARHRDPSNALSVPDYDRRTGNGYVSLGCGGILVVKFNDNALVDIDGPDLHIFEVGTAIEPTQLEISPDNKQWIMIGEVSGGRADIDISNYTQQFNLFRYLRLTDLKQHCGPGSPGSDIDAIGAIGSALQLTLDSGVIFGFNQSLLTTAARTKLDEVIAQIQSYPSAKITVAGHTDNQGANDYNMRLSLQRAQAVSDYISRHLSRSRAAIEAIGYGEKSPIADNDSESGRQKNRRVEIIVMPVSGPTR